LKRCRTWRAQVEADDRRLGQQQPGGHRKVDLLIASANANPDVVTR
jgi:hypothetical protein